MAVRAAKGGAVAGIVGGIALALYMLVGASAAAIDPWPVLKVPGAPFLGARATVPGFDGLAVLVGLLCHFAVSIGWGVLFGIIFWGLSKPGTVVAGALWGIAVWVGMFYVVLPIVGLGEVARRIPTGPAIVEHVLFGLFVGVGFLPFQREVPRRYDIGGPVGPPATPEL